MWKKGMQDGPVWCFPGSPQCRSCYVFKPGRPRLWFVAAGHRVSHDMDLLLRTQKVKVLQIMSAMRRWACLPCWRWAIICQGRTAELTLCVSIWYFSSLPYCSIFSWSPTEDGICRESLFTDENKFRVWVWHGWCRDHLGKSCAVRQCHHGHVQGGGWIKVVQRVSVTAPENFWLLCFVTLTFLKKICVYMCLIYIVSSLMKRC